MRFKGPLSNSFVGAAALVVFALIPYLVLTSAFAPLTPVLSRSVHLSRGALQLTSGLANAGYAIGTVLAVQFAQHLPQRRMLLLYTTLFVIASVVTALAFTPGLFIAGHVLQGLCTSLMLIAAVPPLVIGWPASRVPWSAGVMNLCIFGAVAAGPVLGGLQANAGAWHPLFWAVAGCGGVAWLLVILTFEDQPPANRSAPWDLSAVALAATGCGAAFFGASELATHRFMSLIVFMPLIVGVLLIILLVVHQFAARRPLMPVKLLATTIPVTGIIIALCAGAASVGTIELLGVALQATAGPGHAGALFLPEVGGALVTAGLFAGVLRTRAMMLLPVFGMVCLGGGVAVVTGIVGGPHSLVVVGSALIGIGVGASVAPALFLAGMSVAPTQIQQVFALVELLRAVAAFMTAPVILHIAQTVNGGATGAGIETGLWICLGIAAAGGLVGGYLLVLGRAKPRAPDLERWLDGQHPAWDSPPLLAGIRGEGARAQTGWADTGRAQTGRVDGAGVHLRVPVSRAAR